MRSTCKVINDVIACHVTICQGVNSRDFEELAMSRQTYWAFGTADLYVRGPVASNVLTERVTSKKHGKDVFLINEDRYSRTF